MFRVECEVHECIAIVDLDVEHAEQRESEEAGDLRTFRVAKAGSVEGNHVLIFLAKVAECQYSFVGRIHVFYRATYPLDDRVAIAVYFSDLARGRWRNPLGKRASIQSEEVRGN